MRSRAFEEYWHCPPQFADLEVNEAAGNGDSGYFRVADAVCYGRALAALPSLGTESDLPDLSDPIEDSAGRCVLAFDPDECTDNLRLERYISESQREARGAVKSVLTWTYYLARPLMPVRFRRHLQRAYLRDWRAIPFPRWPVDTSVDTMMRYLMRLGVKCCREPIPFVWFWPDGYKSCTVITHDVETRAGLDFCENLMDIHESHGFRASFQIIPEDRYSVPDRLLDSIRSRGFEVNVHDLNHDGRLYSNRATFLARAARINSYCQQWGARGFRAGAMYRRLDWYDAFEFSYDMSVPNVAHLDPQRGGCCTVTPYFVGNILELPLTTTQDYTLFHILQDYSTRLWKQQIEIIDSFNGLVTLIVHPDYLIERKALDCFKSLLAYLADRRAEKRSWYALPGEVDRWWRTRADLELINCDGAISVERNDARRAILAYARLEDDTLVFTDPRGEVLERWGPNTR